MNKRTRSGLAIIQVAVVLGILGDVLLRQTPWGLNVLLFNLAFAASLFLLLRRHAPERLTAQTYALLGAQVFFASMFVWRDATELRIADTFAIITILGVMFLPTLKIPARVAGVFQYVIGVLWAGINAFFATGVLLGSDISWNDLQIDGRKKYFVSVARGVLIAAPLILIFGALFMAADAVYDGWVRTTLNVDLTTLFSHGIMFTLFTWLTAGYFRGALFAGVAAAPETSLSILQPAASARSESKVDRFRAESGEYPVVLPDGKTVVEHINTTDEHAAGELQSEASEAAGPKQPAWSWANIDNSIVPGFTLGPVEVGVILGLVNLLFISFVIFQVPYLFGGMEMVQNTPDFKLAEYARRGFGELVTVAALVLPMLLVSHWLLKKESSAAIKLFRVLAGIQIALLFVIMASAVQRLVLLTGNLGYGMTTVRLYPMIFMIWLAIVFVWFAATVLRGARQHFAWGALWSAFLILGATHILNPDAFIVKTNIALMQQGRDFDAFYNSSLSDDAIPVLLENLSLMSLDDRCEVGSGLHYRYRQLGKSFDVRSYNRSSGNAYRLLVANDPMLHQTDGCDESFKNDKPATSPPE
ncbi:MAG TPA: DUF4173 domain-containing protein [Pyrinomonadaceae bacterium]|nr:DUF4173 domain-containing protein [Chloracidobacterium sp.]MBP9937093.1 DUF4173 domain-containing protein [Pyrinomonadaceae bacterium]MBK7802106.1 DUF4173 domain-containing protein [Chloracidobacterium sp.]MBL0239654.1 DUF4173 domain-containing protein [Chloracidobacterium sp.]HQX55752.1 DUF4173 domain-containing protein [Pyrinomonadaceae bacterium]